MKTDGTPLGDGGVAFESQCEAEDFLDFEPVQHMSAFGGRPMFEGFAVVGLEYLEGNLADQQLVSVRLHVLW
jgi:hypothetical protein